MTTPQRKYQIRHEERGLCPACAAKVAVKIVKQDDVIVDQRKLGHCWTHHQRRVLYQRMKDQARRKEKD